MNWTNEGLENTAEEDAAYWGTGLMNIQKTLLGKKPLISELG